MMRSAVTLLTSVEATRVRGSKRWNTFGADVLDFTVAEMDLDTAPEVMRVVRDFASSGGFGYPAPAETDRLGVATAAWYERQFDLPVNPGWVFAVADVLKAVEVAIEVSSPPRTPVVVVTPAYPPFFNVLRHLGRPAIQAPLARAGSDYVLDLDPIEVAIKEGAETVLLTHPSNPTGRSFGYEELSGLASLVDRYGVRVVSDEVHAPITYRPHKHFPYAAVGPVAAEHSITTTSAAKGWNIPGLKCAQLIATNARDRRRIATTPFVQRHGMSRVGIVATIAAYTDGQDWLDAVVSELAASRALITELVQERLAPVTMAAPEATYFAWLDFRQLNMKVDPAEFLLERAKVAINSGLALGEGAQGFARLNFASRDDVLIEGIDRLAAALPL